MTIGLDLQLIATAVPVVWDLAHNPTRAISHHPVVENKFTRPWLDHARYRHAAQPGLRRARGAGRNPLPALPDEPELLALYDTLVATVRAVEHHLRISWRHGLSQHTPRPRPSDLISRIATTHRGITPDAPEELVDQVHTTAVTVRPYLVPRQITAHQICRNPRNRRRCTGTPIHDRELELCTSCYQHEAYRARNDRPSLLVDEPDDPRVVSTTESQSAPRARTARPGWARAENTIDPVATVTTHCRTCGTGFTAPITDQGIPQHCPSCVEAA